MNNLILVILGLVLSNNILIAQAGTYQCINFEKKHEKKPEENSVSVETNLLEVNFDDQVNPHITWLMDAETNDPAEITQTWNIISTLSTVRDADPQKVTTTYTANRVLNGAEETGLYYIYKTVDHNMHTLSIVIHSPVDGTKLCFYDMVAR